MTAKSAADAPVAPCATKSQPIRNFRASASVVIASGRRGRDMPLSCRHKGTIVERELVRFGVRPDAPISQFVKRLRCRKCGSGNVMAKRTQSKAAVA